MEQETPNVHGWPADKKARELIEFEAFCQEYGRNDLKLVKHDDSPDFEAEDGSGRRIGVELTIACLSEREVPEHHKRPLSEFKIPPPRQDGSDIREFFSRLRESIKIKIEKARAGYKIFDELVLGIYNTSPVNFYIEPRSWEEFFTNYRDDLEGMEPFTEIFVYNLPRRAGERPRAYSYGRDSGLCIKWLYREL